MMPGDRHGFLVRSVKPDGIGGKMGLLSGDIIVEIDEARFVDWVGLDKLWVTATKNGIIRVKIRRGKTDVFLTGQLN
jgi:S1-C subfamily serine protease